MRVLEKRVSIKTSFKLWLKYKLLYKQRGGEERREMMITILCTIIEIHDKRFKFLYILHTTRSWILFLFPASFCSWSTTGFLHTLKVNDQIGYKPTLSIAEKWAEKLGGAGAWKHSARPESCMNLYEIASSLDVQSIAYTDSPNLGLWEKFRMNNCVQAKFVTHWRVALFTMTHAHLEYGGEHL